MQILSYVIVSMFILAVFILGLYIGNKNRLTEDESEIPAPKRPKGLIKKKGHILNSGPIKTLKKNEEGDRKKDPFKDRLEEIISDDV